MSALSRRQRIEAMLADDPRDQFLRYSLALEFVKEGEHDRSLQLLQELMAETPPMVAAFFMAGQQLTRLRRIADARAVLRDGIEHARQQGDRHAAAEMSDYLSRLDDLGE
jgi:predicted Zn-dependent protease